MPAFDTFRAITAAYNGDVNYNTSASTTLSHTIVAGNSVTALMAVRTSTVYGDLVTLTATVAP